VPFVLLLTALFLSIRRWVPDAKHIFAGLAILALTLLCANLVAAATEFRTDSIRRWIEGKLGLGKRPTQDTRSVIV
jgi:hypothetical protein